MAHEKLAALGIAAAVLAPDALPQHGHEARVDNEYNVITDAQQIGGLTTRETVTVALPGTKTEIARPWAREFADDPAVYRPVGMGTQHDVVRATVRLTTRGGTVRAVEGKGFSSDDDDQTTPDHNPGFGSPSAKNRELANARADAVLPAIQAQVEAITNYPVPAIRVEGEEVSRPEVPQALREAAVSPDQTPETMTKAFNRGSVGELSPEARAILKEVAQDRKVEVTIHADVPADPVTKLTIDKSKVPILANLPRTPGGDVILPDAVSSVDRQQTNAQPVRSNVNGQDNTASVAHTRKQPREQNMSKRSNDLNTRGPRGRVARDTGSNRS